MRFGRGRVIGLVMLGVAATGPAAANAIGKPPLTLAGSNRLEYGLTRAKGDETFEDLFRLSAGWRGFTAEARLHLSEPSEGAAGDSIDQRSFGWSDDHIDLLAGTYYETWGRGLLLRAYETRSATVGRVERSLGFDRDIDGLRLRGRHAGWLATLLSGRPRLTAVSGDPGVASGGRPDRIRGVRVEPPRAGPVRGAASLLRVNIPSSSSSSNRAAQRTHFASGEIAASGDWYDIALEGALRRSDAGAERKGDALYGSAGAYHGSFSLNWEYADYDRFGGRYNEPPTLVKTQGWTLLNRATHVAEYDDTVAHQFEAGWASGPETGITVNHSRSGRHHDDADFRFREWTVEGRHRPGEAGPRLKAVVDRAQDALKGVDRRWTAGGEAEIMAGETNSIDLIVEWQQIDPLFGPRRTRRLGQIEYQRAPWLTVTAQGERLADPDAVKRRWGSLTVNLAWGAHHNLNLFYGSRPDGFLCTGGYCFFAPAFDGLEMRWLSRF